jgi:branched-chain amino acid transport system substrate-binding protein
MRHYALPLLTMLLLAAAPVRADITIAAMEPLTGQDAATGEQMRRGIDAAAAAVNAAGGILGQQVKVVYKDDACDPKQGVAVANQLGGEHVAAVIGPVCSGVAIPIAPILNEEGLVMISPSATNPAVTESHFDNVFRVCGRDDQQGTAVGKYVAQHFGTKKIAILHDKTAFGHGLADEMKKALNAAGVKELFYDGINRGERDFGSLIARFKEAGIDVVFFGGYHPEAGLLVRQIHDRGLNITLVSDDGIATSEFWSITGAAGEGTLMAFMPDPRKNPEAKDAVERIRATGFEPEGFTLQSYAAFEVLAQAMTKAGKVDSVALVKVMHSGEFSTVLGKISFDAKGDVKNPQYAMYRWSAGTYHEIDAP